MLENLAATMLMRMQSHRRSHGVHTGSTGTLQGVALDRGGLELGVRH